MIASASACFVVTLRGQYPETLRVDACEMFVDCECVIFTDDCEENVACFPVDQVRAVYRDGAILEPETSE